MKILFICTHNRCRSILAEAIANHVGQGEIKAASAGSNPAGKVDLLALKTLKKLNIQTKGLSSKSWNEMEHFEPDFVITVCDNAASESCPLWFGQALQAHWGLADPSIIDAEKSPDKAMAAYMETAELLISRLNTLAELLSNNPNRTSILNTLHTLSEKEPLPE